MHTCAMGNNDRQKPPEQLKKGIEPVQCGALRIQAALGTNWSGGGGTDCIAELRAELLDDEGEAAGDLLEHGVAEGPVLLGRDLARDLPRRHPQLHQGHHLLRPRQRAHRPLRPNKLLFLRLLPSRGRSADGQ
jgi:hypothetical protein